MARTKSGQPFEHTPTDKSRAFVSDLYMCGVPQERIAKHLEISVETLVKHYRADLDLALDEANTVIAKTLFQQARAGDQKSQEFWLKTRARFSYAKPQEELDKDAVIKSLIERCIDKL